MPFTIHADPHTQDCRRRVWGFFAFIEKKNTYLLRQVLSVSPFGHKIIPQWQDTLPRLHHYLNTILFVCQYVSKGQITTFLQELGLFRPSSLYLIEFSQQDPSRLLVSQLLIY